MAVTEPAPAPRTVAAGRHAERGAASTAEEAQRGRAKLEEEAPDDEGGRPPPKPLLAADEKKREEVVVEPPGALPEPEPVAPTPDKVAAGRERPILDAPSSPTVRRRTTTPAPWLRGKGSGTGRGVGYGITGGPSAKGDRKRSATAAGPRLLIIEVDGPQTATLKRMIRRLAAPVRSCGSRGLPQKPPRVRLVLAADGSIRADRGAGARPSRAMACAACSTCSERKRARPQPRPPRHYCSCVPEGIQSRSGAPVCARSALSVTPSARSTTRKPPPSASTSQGRQIGDDAGDAAHPGEGQRALLEQLGCPGLGGVGHEDDDAASAADQIHRAAHAVDALARDHPVRQIAAGAHLHPAEDGGVHVARRESSRSWSRCRRTLPPGTTVTVCFPALISLGSSSPS